MYSDTDTPPVSISLDYTTLLSDNIIAPWELCEKLPISVRELISIEKANFYQEFSKIVQKYPDSTRKLLGLIQRTSYYLRKHELKKDTNNLIYVQLFKDFISGKVSKDVLEKIILEINHSGKYDRKARLSNSSTLDNEMYRRIKVVITESEKQSSDITLDRLFGILKTHFPMLTSEQIHSTLRKEGKIGEK